jgi:hypothetical protein
MRDRLCAKHPHYTVRECVLYASELKGLRASGCGPDKLNPLPLTVPHASECARSPLDFPGVVRVRQAACRVLQRTRVGNAVRQCVRLDREDPAREGRDAPAYLLETALARSHAEYILWSAGIDCAALAALNPSPRPSSSHSSPRGKIKRGAPVSQHDSSSCHCSARKPTRYPSRRYGDGSCTG